MNSRVSIVKTTDRDAGIAEAIRLLGVNPVDRKDVLLKPNFNTADPFPASTHNDTLRHLIEHLKAMGASGITIGERSGPVDTASVIKDKGIPQLCSEEGAGLINFENLPEDQWVRKDCKDSHWRKGFLIAKPVIDSDCIVCTCCLKTHGFGGGITASLKLSIGMVHKRNMTELHSSMLSMKKMIAEVNTAYTPALVLMDAIDVFTDRGPMSGPVKRAGLILASADRVAIDAVGLAILKLVGSNSHVMNTRIWEHQQIARAAELGLGAKRPSEIEIVHADEPLSMDTARDIERILKAEA